MANWFSCAPTQPVSWANYLRLSIQPMPHWIEVQTIYVKVSLNQQFCFITLGGCMYRIRLQMIILIQWTTHWNHEAFSNIFSLNTQQPTCQAYGASFSRSVQLGLMVPIVNWITRIARQNKTGFFARFVGAGEFLHNWMWQKRCQFQLNTNDNCLTFICNTMCVCWRILEFTWVCCAPINIVCTRT